MGGPGSQPRADHVRPPADVPALARWRADTPGCERRVHLNNAGASMVPSPVRQAVDAHLDLEDELGGYEAVDARVEALRDAGDAVAGVLGAHRRNLALSQNSTTAFAQALDVFDFASGDVILTSRADYASNQIMYLSLARRLGVEIVRAPDLAEGGVDPSAVCAGPPPPAHPGGDDLDPDQLRPGPGGARHR